MNLFFLSKNSILWKFLILLLFQLWQIDIERKVRWLQILDGLRFRSRSCRTWDAAFQFSRLFLSIFISYQKSIILMGTSIREIITAFPPGCGSGSGYYTDFEKSRIRIRNFRRVGSGLNIQFQKSSVFCLFLDLDPGMLKPDPQL